MIRPSLSILWFSLLLLVWAESAPAGAGKIRGTAGGMERGVSVFAADGSLVGWTVTGPSGLYEFGGVAPGRYCMLLAGKIVPNVHVRPDMTTVVDYAGQPKLDLEKELWAPARIRFAQSFIAKGTGVTGFSLWRASGSDKLQVSLYDGSPDGRRIAGPVLTEKPMVWICGSSLPVERFRTVPGNRYTLELASADAKPWNHSMPREPDVYPDGMAYFDGVPHSESDLGIEINQQRPGLTSIASAREDLHFIAEGPGSGLCRVAGQTFVANASNVVQAYANCGGWGAGVAEFVFSVHREGPGGPQVGPACHVKMVCNWGADVVWFSDAVALERGERYYLQYRRVDNEPFFSYLSADEYKDGRAYRDGKLLARQFDQLCYIRGEQEFHSVTYPYDVRVRDVTADEATITWRTGTTADGLVRFGTDRYLKQTAVSPGNTATHHRITLADLSPGTVYLYRVASDTARKSSRRMFSRVYSFLTMPQGPDQPRFDQPLPAKSPPPCEDCIEIPNAGFEQGLEGWYVRARSGRPKEPETYVADADPLGSAALGMDGYYAHTGHRCYGWSYSGSEDTDWTEPREVWNRELVSRSIRVDPGRQYLLKAWICTGDLGSGWGRDSRIRLVVDEHGGDTMADFQTVERANVTQWFATQHRWLPVTLEFTARADEVKIGAEFLQWWALRATHLYIDEFSVVPRK